MAVESVYRGLAAPRRTFSAGRPDIAAEDRPGSILLGIVNEAVLAGEFGMKGPSADVVRSPSTAARQAPSLDYGAFVDAFDDEPTLS